MDFVEVCIEAFWMFLNAVIPVLPVFLVLLLVFSLIRSFFFNER